MAHRILITQIKETVEEKKYSIIERFFGKRNTTKFTYEIVFEPKEAFEPKVGDIIQVLLFESPIARINDEPGEVKEYIIIVKSDFKLHLETGYIKCQLIRPELV
jgi:hypothetical protein